MGYGQAHPSMRMSTCTNAPPNLTPAAPPHSPAPHRRYVVDWSATQRRRQLVSDTWLAQHLGAVRQRLQRGLGLDPQQARALQMQELQEQMQLMRCAIPGRDGGGGGGGAGEQLPGRQSGSEAWRSARGETGGWGVWALSGERRAGASARLRGEHDGVKSTPHIKAFNSNKPPLSRPQARPQPRGRRRPRCTAWQVTSSCRPPLPPRAACVAARAVHRESMPARARWWKRCLMAPFSPSGLILGVAARGARRGLSTGFLPAHQVCVWWPMI